MDTSLNKEKYCYLFEYTPYRYYSGDETQKRQVPIEVEILNSGTSPTDLAYALKMIWKIMLA